MVHFLEESKSLVMCQDQNKSEGNKIAQDVLDINGAFASCCILQNLTAAELNHSVDKRKLFDDYVPDAFN